MMGSKILIRPVDSPVRLATVRRGDGHDGITDPRNSYCRCSEAALVHLGDVRHASSLVEGYLFKAKGGKAQNSALTGVAR